MSSDRRKRRAAAVTLLGEAFRQKVTAVTLAAYEMGLSDLSADDVERAVKAAIQSCKFMPTVVELRELAGESTGNDRAIQAWGVVVGAVHLGSYKSVDFDDPLINASIRMLGGWPAILERSPEEFDKWVRNDFLKTYASLMRTGVDGEACRALPGLSQTTGDVTTVNGKRLEYRGPEPVRIASGLPALPGIAKVEPAKVDRSEQPAITFRKP